jgi:hypothetical protein
LPGLLHLPPPCRRCLKKNFENFSPKNAKVRFFGSPCIYSTYHLEYEEWTLVSIRNRRQYSLVRHWPGCSWRFSKIYALIKRENGYQDVLSWMAYGVDRVGTDSELHDALQFLNTLNCPYLCENLYSWADEKGIGVIRNLFADGSLRDRLYKVSFGAITQ